MGQPIMPKRKGLSTGSLQEVTEPFYGEKAKAPTRADNRRNSAIDVNLVNVGDILEECKEVIGSTNISNPSANISPFEIDELASELIVVRNAKDVIEGRESALKAYATEVINMRIATSGKDFATESGYLVSTEAGVKLSKETSGGKLTVDVELLEAILDEDQFHSVTNLISNYRTITYPDGKTVEETTVTRELNEEALEKQLKLGNIGMEQVIKATTPGKVRSAFYVRSL
jgi:hypothetical protein